MTVKALKLEQRVRPIPIADEALVPGLNNGQGIETFLAIELP
jgi:hypothetical protein